VREGWDEWEEANFVYFPIVHVWYGKWFLCPETFLKGCGDNEESDSTEFTSYHRISHNLS